MCLLTILLDETFHILFQPTKKETSTSYPASLFFFDNNTTPFTCLYHPYYYVDTRGLDCSALMIGFTLQIFFCLAINKAMQFAHLSTILQTTSIWIEFDFQEFFIYSAPILMSELYLLVRIFVPIYFHALQLIVLEFILLYLPTPCRPLIAYRISSDCGWLINKIPLRVSTSSRTVAYISSSFPHKWTPACWK